MDDCVFCKIGNGSILTDKIWEDANFVAFLDNNPATEGMTLVIPKRHLDSYVFKNDDRDIHDLMTAAKNVSLMLENAFILDRVAAVFEGIEISHLHLKLYPLKPGETLKTVLNRNNYKPSREELSEMANIITKKD
jgi:histidine triad (HIT) family protein